jgi:hypothetical protein
VVSFVNGWVGVQAGVIHDAVDEIIDDRRNAADSAEAFVEGGLHCFR